MKLVKVYSIVVLSTLLFSACTSSKVSTATNVTPKTKSNLYTTEWKLVEDDNYVKGFRGDNVNLTIEDNSFKVTGYAGCNSYFTDATINGSAIKFNPIGRTKMSCPSLKVENSFINMLEAVNRFEVKGNELYFYKDNMLLLKFKN